MSIFNGLEPWANIKINGGAGLKVHSLQDEVVGLTRELVRHPSLSGQEQSAAMLVRQFIQSLDFDEVWVDELGNVVAARYGDQPGPRLLFDAHLDVVPPTQPDSWTCDPFGGEMRDGRIWGRGATDIKGGLAALLLGLGNLPRRDLKGALFISASIGEEHMEGAALQPIVARTQPDFAVICEPTGCQLGVAQKGRTEFWIQVAGTPAHTSQPDMGDNAIYRAAEIIQDLRRLPLAEDPLLGRAVMELIEIVSSPFPGNCIVPDGCRLRYDRRLLPGDTRQSLMDSLHEAMANHQRWSIGFQPVRLETYTGHVLEGEHFYPAWTLPEDSPWLAKARQGLEMNGLTAKSMAVPYCTNASFTAGQAGIPSLIFGPSDISLAHIVDEYVEVDELMRAVAGFTGLAKALAD